MNYQNLLFEIKNHTGVITINRPDKLNALNNQTMIEIADVFNSIKNNPEVYVVVFTGSGEKAFVAGADISELNKLDVISAKEFSEKGNNVFRAIETSDKPVIAAVNGFALGGGCELALACHIRIASENAKFGQPEVNLGIIPGYGGTQRLARVINSARSLEMILTGDMITAEEAFRIGLVNKVYPQNELLTKTLELADKISSKGQHAIRFALKAVKATDNMSLTEGLSYEASLFALTCGTEDFKEGTSAFLQKRKPEFKNR
ncbi:MAG: enoyl-CoA hydratase [Ignavibacteriota bacterium]|jgi:enoyl-CoA hydratase|nr:MAG: enoyl-CoA hydratase [Chlorobiota bacterium]MBE7477255.1 enoyl-CoA hydratase/isomerase family protein [Ignavibacteriales bacterium]MBL1122641.1 enoyl-CoA hydratase [Ignavibacteriota bacterium]MBV6419106.1 Crotonyl-CoA hydratase [Ignavibacteriaceae bacterium]MCE7856278.1 enoyl-CoA hydratase [Ignavibacteria bacterium CHB3]MEB2295674.1 enoyl-CoA hydratase-related protein [Ignavibacteria bacterium]